MHCVVDVSNLSKSAIRLFGKLSLTENGYVIQNPSVAHGMEEIELGGFSRQLKKPNNM